MLLRLMCINCLRFYDISLMFPSRLIMRFQIILQSLIMQFYEVFKVRRPIFRNKEVSLYVNVRDTADTERRYDIWETVKGNVISYFFYRRDRIRRYFLYLSILPLISVSGFGVSNEAERHIWCNL